MEGLNLMMKVTCAAAMKKNRRTLAITAKEATILSVSMMSTTADTMSFENLGGAISQLSGCVWIKGWCVCVCVCVSLCLCLCLSGEVGGKAASHVP